MYIPINDQLALTKLLPTDREAVLSHLKDPCIAAATVGIPHPYTADDFAAMLAKAEAAELGYGHAMYLGIRDASGLLIGCINFQEVVGEGVLELGYWLAKPWWGRGIMTRAIRAACHHTFFEWDVGVVFASCFLSNVASRRVLEKNGFVCDGRHQLVKVGEPIDSWMFVLEAPPF